jgi:glycosyltransferase involved in cell wall biosynthesis
MLPLSVFLITKNEAHNLPRCLDAIKDLAAEIVIIDSGSTDETEQIAQQYGARFSYRAFDGFGQQKYHAEQLCNHNWVLNLDADEVVTPELAHEIRHFLDNGLSNSYDGARLKIVSLYPHQDKPRLWADYYNPVRLYNKSKLHYRQHASYDRVVLEKDTPIYQFKNIILHYSYASLEALEEKKKARTRFYFEYENDKGGKIKNMLRLGTEFPRTFLKSYFLKRQFTGGLHGLKLSYLHAKYRHLRIAQRVKGKCLVDE